MKTLSTTLCAAALLVLASPAAGQDGTSDREELQLAAMEALITAPAERALPLARKVVTGDYSNEMKERALFVLSQIDRPDARELILDVARNSSGDLRHEAVRMIGISGNREALMLLGDMYIAGDENLNEAIVEAYLIAGDEEAVYALATQALAAEDAGGFQAAVEALGAMGAREQLARLRTDALQGNADISEALIEAYAITGDFDSLRELAIDASDPGQQAAAIEALGIVGGGAVDQLLVEIYRNATENEIREAALEGMLISGYDAGVLELYRASDDPAEKKALLETLVMMDSEEVWAILDSALDGGA